MVKVNKLISIVTLLLHNCIWNSTYNACTKASVVWLIQLKQLNYRAIVHGRPLSLRSVNHGSTVTSVRVDLYVSFVSCRLDPRMYYLAEDHRRFIKRNQLIASYRFFVSRRSKFTTERELFKVFRCRQVRPLNLESAIERFYSKAR